jgi:hypothetical protein
MAEVFERDICLFKYIWDFIDLRLLPVHHIPGPGGFSTTALARPEVERLPGVRVDDSDHIQRIEQPRPDPEQQEEPSPAPEAVQQQRCGHSSPEESAETFTANYIEAERKAGRTPTQMGLERSARGAGINRTHLREAFHKLHEVRRGRRRKSAE